MTAMKKSCKSTKALKPTIVKKPTRKATIRTLRPGSPALKDWVQRAQAYAYFIAQCEKIKRIIGPIIHHNHLTGRSAPLQENPLS